MSKSLLILPNQALEFAPALAGPTPDGLPFRSKPAAPVGVTAT